MSMKLDPSRRRQRKMRTSGKDMCTCGLLNCDSMHSMMDTPYIRKLKKRQEAKVCIGCGKTPCKCKRNLKTGVIVSEELKHKKKLEELRQYLAFQEWKNKKKN